MSVRSWSEYPDIFLTMAEIFLSMTYLW
jgi:hypothetical protein